MKKYIIFAILLCTVLVLCSSCVEDSEYTIKDVEQYLDTLYLYKSSPFRVANMRAGKKVGDTLLEFNLKGKYTHIQPKDEGNKWYFYMTDTPGIEFSVHVEYVDGGNVDTILYTNYCEAALNYYWDEFTKQSDLYSDPDGLGYSTLMFKTEQDIIDDVAILYDWFDYLNSQQYKLYYDTLYLTYDYDGKYTNLPVELSIIGGNLRPVFFVENSFYTGYGESKALVDDLISLWNEKESLYES